MGDKYKNICVRVDSDLKIGSGFLLKSSNNYYIITSLHCISNGEKNILCEKIKLWSDYQENRVDFLFEKDKAIFFNEGTDLAIIELMGKFIINGDNTNIKDISELKINFPIINANKDNELDSILIGYPKSKRMTQNITLERSKIEIRDYKFDNQLGVFHKTDCFYEGGEVLDEKLVGYSGSGIFYESKGTIFLNGIFFKYIEKDSLGEAISPIKLIEVFSNHGLELPSTTDNFIKIKLKEASEKLIKKQLASDYSLYERCKEFEKNFDLEIDEIEKIIINLNKNKYNYPIENYIKLFVEKLYLLNYFSKKFNLDSNMSSIKIESLLAKIFISQYDDFDEMRSEFIRFINDDDIKINKMDNIYIKDIHNIDGGDFECITCRYLEKGIVSRVYNKILSTFNIGKEKNERFNIMGNDRNEKKITVRCADCISVHKKKKLSEIGEKLWS